MARVVLRNVEKAYAGGARVVKDFSLDVADTELVVFVGPSGCGKSTTLRCVAGLEDVTGGTIHIGGRLVNDVPAKDRDIAMVFQNYALYPHMTVYENMAFPLTMRGTPKAVVKERVDKAVSILGLQKMLDRKPKTLSGGQRQRVAVGRAIVRDPKCFLFDEPLSNLDAKLRVEMRAEIKRIHRSLGSTTIYVTHDQEEAMTLGDRVVVLKDGVIQQCGAPLDVYQRPANRFVAGFVGMPPMNFFEGTILEAAGALWFNEGSGLLRVPPWARRALEEKRGDRVVLGARPQALSLQVESAESALLMSVNVVEMLGETMDVFLSTAQHPHVVAHVAADRSLVPGAPRS
ncbi:MAG TPA: sn-glycerol-3-phosphate ABC transporter ATP-binding protein UgpC, partial [Polyangiaceae bacterium]